MDFIFIILGARDLKLRYVLEEFHLFHWVSNPNLDLRLLHESNTNFALESRNLKVEKVSFDMKDKKVHLMDLNTDLALDFKTNYIFRLGR